MKIRKPAVAGMFYPEDPEKLKLILARFIENAEKSNIGNDIKNPKAIIVPHAGIVYSGQMAAYAYNLIKNSKQKKFIILGPAHASYISEITADDNDEWQTPLGNAKVMNNHFTKSAIPHISEHNLEVQVIFLQIIKNDFEMLPLLVGNSDPKTIADNIEKILDDDTLLIVSTDLSHFYDYNAAKDMDLKTIDAIEQGKSESMGEACGALPVKACLEIAKRKKWKIKKLGYYNSGDIIGDKNSVVGYASFVLY
ncbi:MAG: AmmeMemoRadiSam system protein B [Candidatus Woesearchaeota archaeon]